MEVTPEGHPDQALILDYLRYHLSRKYKLTGNLQDLEATISLSEAIVEAAPDSHPKRADWLRYAGIYLGSRYERTGSLPDLEAAIARLEAAVDITPEGHPRPARASMLADLGELSDRKSVV